MLCCTIKDNGIGRKQAALLKTAGTKHVSRGVQLIEKRLQILKDQTGKPVLLHTTDLYDAEGAAAGTMVEITLPAD